MKVEQFRVNSLGVNCYVVYDGHEGVIIDPGVASDKVLAFVEEHGLQIVAIIDTHGHADHIAGNAWFVEKTKAHLYIHELDAPYLQDPALHLGPQIYVEVTPTTADRLLREGDSIQVGKSSLAVLHTPGHTPGGICLYSPGILFSGDTLFRTSVGRSDLPLGNQAVLNQSLRRLTQLPPETVVYPGHGPNTTIYDELRTNPFL